MFAIVVTYTFLVAGSPVILTGVITHPTFESFAQCEDARASENAKAFIASSQASLAEKLNGTSVSAVSECIEHPPDMTPGNPS